MPQGYGTDEDLIIYWDGMGYDYSSIQTDTVLAQLRLQGSMYIDGTYERQFFGSRTGGLTQERAWPRTGVMGVDANEIPDPIVWASYEAAYIALTNPAYLNTSVVPNQRITEVKAGTAGVKYSDSGDTVTGSLRYFGRIAGLLMPFLRRVNMPAAMVV